MPLTPASLPADLPAAPDALLQTLLDINLTGVLLLSPIYGPDGVDAVDFALDYLNPAGQRMVGLPARPGGTLLGRFPQTREAGSLAFYQRAFETGSTEHFEVNYQADGLDNFFRHTARRCGPQLLVSFTDTADQPRTAVEEALRQSQAAERAARAEAETRRQRFYDVLMHLPAQVATYHGPEHVYAFVNKRYQRYFPTHELLGHSIRQVLPEIDEQGIAHLLDRVYQTGEPFHAPEQEAWIDFTNTGQREQIFVNLFFHPLRDAQGRIDGVLDFSYDVTEQVRARQQVQQLNEELEARVAARTRDVQAARAEAEAQRQLLQLVLAQAPVGIGVFQGDDLVVVQANDGLSAMWGHEPAQVLGRPLLEGVPELRGQGFEELIREVGRTRVPFVGTEVPAALRRADGQLETHYFNFVYQPLYGPAGEGLGVLGIATDVTGQVQARQQAEGLQAEVVAAAQRQVQERATLYQVFEQTPAALCIQRGPAHRYEYVNPAYQALFPDRQFVGRTVAEALPETVDGGILPLLDGVYQTGEPFFGFEVPLTLQPTAAGAAARTEYYTFTYQAYRENGEIVGISTFAYNVTQQALARQEREAQQRRLYALFEQAPVGICIFDGPDLVYEFVNPSYQRLLPGRALLGRPLYQALPELANTDVERLLRHVYETGETQQEEGLLVSVARADGNELEERYFTIVYQARRDEHGRINGIVNFIVEVTEQVQARQRVQELNEELAAINEELTATNEDLNDTNTRLTRTNVDLDNFIYTASHDLKAPITNIEGLLDALQAELPPAARVGEVEPVLGMMQDSVDRFKRTIEHLTDVSRLQKEHAQPATQVALAPVIEDVRLDLAPLLADTGGRLDVQVPAGLTCSFSEKNLRSVIYNLLSNALKYRHPARVPQVRISCQRAGSYTVLEVQDNGLGLDLTQEEQLFAMFRRLHTHVEGSGIGLYMVKKMVENAGGRIEVQSQLGVGSTFVVFFPVSS